MDQRVVAGIGNIYANEALWRSGIDPSRESATLSVTESGALLHELPETSVIVVTETASLDEAVTALQEGASDFLIKSLLNDDILRVSVQRAMERRTLRQENRRTILKLNF